jgi:hypothetical protein
VDVRTLGVDLLSVAGHKLYAPKGVGALYVRRGTLLLPFVLGAGHERGLRPGTENVASIVGLGVAAEIAARELRSAAERMRRLRDELWESLSAAVPGLRLNGHASLRLPNTLNVRFPGVSGTAILDGAPAVGGSWLGPALARARYDAGPDRRCIGGTGGHLATAPGGAGRLNAPPTRRRSIPQLHHCCSQGSPSLLPSIFVSGQFSTKKRASAHEVIWEQCVRPSQLNRLSTAREPESGAVSSNAESAASRGASSV